MDQRLGFGVETEERWKFFGLSNGRTRFNLPGAALGGGGGGVAIRGRWKRGWSRN